MRNLIPKNSVESKISIIDGVFHNVFLRQQTDVNTTLVYCWPTVYDSCPALSQHWVNVSCLLSVILHTGQCLGMSQEPVVMTYGQLIRFLHPT